MTEIVNESTLEAMKEAEDMLADPDALKFSSVEELFDELRTEDRKETDEEAEKKGAFERLEEMIRPIPSLDYDRELAEYREEKYGKA